MIALPVEVKVSKRNYVTAYAYTVEELERIKREAPELDIHLKTFSNELVKVKMKDIEIVG